MDTGGGDRARYLAVGAVLVLAIGAAALLLQGDASLPGRTQGVSETGNESTDPFQQYAEPEEASGTTEVPSDVEVGATVEILEAGVSPGRAEIKVGQAVKWVNTNDFPVRMSFSSTPQTPTVEPGGTVTLRFRGNAEYSLNNTETGESLAGGFVYVE